MPTASKYLFVCMRDAIHTYVLALNECGKGLETYDMQYAMTQTIGLAIIKTNVFRCQRIFLFIILCHDMCSVLYQLTFE